MESNKLGTEKIGKLVFYMTLPSIAAQIVNLMYNIVDRVFIGHIQGAGATALTGVGLTSPMIVIISAFSAFVGNGGAPLASMALGKKEQKRAEKILGNGVTLLVGIAVILMIVIGLFKEPILYGIGASDKTYPYAVDYLSIYLIGTVMVLFTVGLAPFVIAQGKSKVAMAAVILGAVINIVLDWLFINYYEFGVKGAAWATVIAQTCSALWLLYYLVFKAESLKIKRENLRLDKDVVKSIASIGVSPFVMSSTESLISIVMNSGLQKYGGDNYVGCLTVMQSIMQFIGVPINGFTQGVTPIISYNYGAGYTKRVKGAMKWTFIAMFVYTFSFALTTMCFPESFARIFTDEAELIALTGRALPIFMMGMLIFGVQRACQTSFLALGQAKISLFIALLRKVFLLVPLALILPRFFGVFGIYYAEPIADATAATTCGIIFMCNINKILKTEAKC